MSNVYIITGPPGSGKSTLSSYLASRFDLGIHIHCDDIYNMVRGGYKFPWDDADGFLMNTMFDATVELQKVYTAKKFHCVIDYVFDLDQLQGLLKVIEAPVSLIVLLPDCDTNISRDHSREHSIGGDRVKFYNDYFNQISSTLKDFIIDNSEMSIEEASKKIIAMKSHSSASLIANINFGKPLV